MDAATRRRKFESWKEACVALREGFVINESSQRMPTWAYTVDDLNEARRTGVLKGRPYAVPKNERRTLRRKVRARLRRAAANLARATREILPISGLEARDDAMKATEQLERDRASALDELDQRIVQAARDARGFIHSGDLFKRCRPWEYGICKAADGDKSAWRKRLQKLVSLGYLQRNGQLGKSVRWTEKEP
jgi:hypothetical protein